MPIDSARAPLLWCILTAVDWVPVSVCEILMVWFGELSGTLPTVAIMLLGWRFTVPIRVRPGLVPMCMLITPLFLSIGSRSILCVRCLGLMWRLDTVWP